MFEAGSLEYDFIFVLAGLAIGSLFGFYVGTNISQQPCDCNTTAKFSCQGLLLNDCASRYLTDYNILFSKEPQQPEQSGDNQ